MFHEFFHIKTIISYHIHFFMLLDNERICGDEGDSDMSVGDFCRQYRGMPRLKQNESDWLRCDDIPAAVKKLAVPGV